MANCKLRSLLYVLCLTHGAVSFQWTSEIGNNATRFVCRGHNLVLPWNFTSTNETADTILIWYYQGLSEEVIATMPHGHFVPSPSFSGRVEFLPRAGIILKNVIPGDSGNYSVEVVTHAGETERQNAIVEITDAPSTSSGDLNLQQDMAAVHNDTTGTWSVQLTCGHFSSLGQPPVDIIWTTPAGVTQQSTNYHGGNFHLILPNPVRGGNYSCAIVPQSPAASCLPGSSPLLKKAVVNVDEVVARLTLIEARQSETSANLSSYIHYLEDKDANLTSQIHHLEDKDANLTSQIHHLEDKDANLTSQIYYMEDKDANLTSQVHSLTSQVHYLEDTNANLTSQIRNLEDRNVSLTSQIHFLDDKDANLTSEIHKLQEFTACGSLNYKVLSDAWRATTNVDSSTTYCDSSLTAGWYRFKLNGADADIPTSCVRAQTHRCGTVDPMWLDLQGKSLPGLGQEVMAVACNSYGDYCCVDGFSKPVTVRNCGQFYIYNLQPVVCHQVYCTTSH